MKKLLSITVLLLIGAYLLLTNEGTSDAEREKRYQNVPWNVTFPSENTLKVLGVTLGQNNLEDIQKIFNSDFELGLYVTKDNQPSLEAYFNSVKQAGLSAKAIVHINIKNQPWQQWIKNQAKYKSLPNGEIKYSLSAEDFRTAKTLPVNFMAYIPTVNLDEDIVNNRFGEEHQNFVVSDTVTYWLYPSKGMAIRLDSKGKEIISYTHPDNIKVITQAIDAEIAEMKEKAKLAK